MTAPAEILVQSIDPREQSAKGVHFQLTCNLCRDSLKTQVWLCFVVLSFLSTSTYAVFMRDIEHLKICLDGLIPSIQKSDAMLYAPAAGDVEEKCKILSLKCYMLELNMVMDEEEIWDNTANCIRDFKSKQLPEADTVGCQPCEAHPLRNITIFINRLSDLLKEVITVDKRNNWDDF